MSPAVQWARRVVLGLAMVWGLIFVAIVATRIGFALELEWMEGGSLLQAWRIQRGLPIYAEPSVDYVPFLYTPLYSVVLAGLGFVFPLDFLLGRAVSVFCTVLICIGMWRAVDREGKPTAHKAAAVALFLSGYVFTFRWFDLARADMMAMALVLWGSVMLREAWGDRRKTIAAALLMGAAFWTKQTGFVFAAAGLASGLLVAPRQLWLYAVVLAAVGFGGVAYGQSITDGWLWTYIYELHQSHAFNQERFTRKTWGMFVHAAPFLTLLVVGLWLRFWWPWLAMTKRFDDGARHRLFTRLRAHRGVGYWGMFTVVALVASALGYSTQWAEPNAFIPGVCFAAVFIAVALPTDGRSEAIALALVAVQLVFAVAVEPYYQPIQRGGLAGLGDSYGWQRLDRTVPSADEREAASSLRADIEASGPMLALHRPWWSVIAGGEGHVGSMNLNDIYASQREQLRTEIATRVRNGEFRTIAMEGVAPAWLRSSLAVAYTLDQRRIGSRRVLPKSGYMSEAGMVSPYRSPQLVFRLPKARERPNRARVIADFEDATAQGFELTGAAFGHAPVRSVHRSFPAIGPIGGEYVLSSAASRSELEAKGVARSPAFTLPAAGGRVELLLGRAGRTDGLRVTVERVWGQGVVELPIEASRYTLRSVDWAVPPSWAGQAVRLTVIDDTERGAVFLDDVWVVDAGS